MKSAAEHMTVAGGQILDFPFPVRRVIASDIKRKLIRIVLAVDLFTKSNRSANGPYLAWKIVMVMKQDGIRTYNSQLMQHF